MIDIEANILFMCRANGPSANVIHTEYEAANELRIWRSLTRKGLLKTTDHVWYETTPKGLRALRTYMNSM